MSPSEAAPSASAFRYRRYRLYWTARLLATFAAQIVGVAVGWQVYELTRSALNLGLVGLVQFLPSLVLVLVTGAAADRFNRRRIMGLCILAELACTAGLLAFTRSGGQAIWPVFLALSGIGVARAFLGPAMQSLLPNLVPPPALGSAIALNSSSVQVATIAGPVAGGLLYGIAPEAAYGIALAFLAAAMLLTLLIPKPEQHTVREPPSWSALLAGFAFIWREKVMLGAISLDMVAVLLGGATALMPIYARDILEAGPWGLGLLRAAPAIGAVPMAVWLSVRPIRDHAGPTMFATVALFGVFTMVFGLSGTTWLSVAALILMGACNMLSVYIRMTLIQLWTPDALRGRVTAVNLLFVGASNELGEFRAGVSASLFGAVAAVVLGGAGTLLVAGLWRRLFPELARARALAR